LPARAPRGPSGAEECVEGIGQADGKHPGLAFPDVHESMLHLAVDIGAISLFEANQFIELGMEFDSA
jgi:hypothetical protein